MQLKQKVFSYLLLFFILLIGSYFTPSHANNGVQREIYKDFLANLSKSSKEESQTKLFGLTTYPLYRYAHYRLLLTHADTIPGREIVQFIEAEPHSAVNDSLISIFLTKWSDNENWTDIELLSQLIKKNQYTVSLDNQCILLTNDRKQGRSIEKEHLAKIWLTSRNIPKPCDELMTYYLGQVDKDDALLQRIVLAINGNNIKLASYLVKQLSSNAKNDQKDLITWLEKTTDLSPLIEGKTTEVTKRIAIEAFRLFAKKHLMDAQRLKTKFASAQKLNEVETNQLNDILLNQLLLLNAPSDEELKLREALFKETRDDALIAYRLRIALRENDWPKLAAGINQLSSKAQQEDTWQYWQARVLQKEGQTEQARLLLLELMKGRGFYPMVAAQTLNTPYEFKLPAIENTQLTKNDKVILDRVSEFVAFGQLGPAKREWLFAIKQSDKARQIAFAQYAIEKGWADLAVSATIEGKLWDYLSLRFPTAYLEIFKQEIAHKNVPLSYALAIARQESAWSFDVVSPAGAKGLMQVMPATADQVAKQHKITRYQSDKSLIIPAINIEIGVHYLNDRLADYDNNRIFATASYNAGAARVKFWRNRTQDQVDSIQFIESISFPETRQYVKNVLVFDLYYQYLLEKQGIMSGRHPFLLTAKEWEMLY